MSLAEHLICNPRKKQWRLLLFECVDTCINALYFPSARDIDSVTHTDGMDSNDTGMTFRLEMCEGMVTRRDKLGEVRELNYQKATCLMWRTLTRTSMFHKQIATIKKPWKKATFFHGFRD